MMDQLGDALLRGKAQEVVTCVTDALAQGMSAEAILNQGLCKGMEEVGDRFRSGQFFVPQVLLAARAMQKGLELLKPHLVAAGVKPVGTASDWDHSG